jgi:hypothetical protein
VQKPLTVLHENFPLTPDGWNPSDSLFFLLVLFFLFREKKEKNTYPSQNPKKADRRGVLSDPRG